MSIKSTLLKVVTLGKKGSEAPTAPETPDATPATPSSGATMKSFWAAVAKLAGKVLVYAAEHPDQVQAVINGIQEAKKG